MALEVAPVRCTVEHCVTPPRMISHGSARSWTFPPCSHPAVTSDAWGSGNRHWTLAREQPFSPLSSREATSCRTTILRRAFFAAYCPGDRCSAGATISRRPNVVGDSVARVWPLTYVVRGHQGHPMKRRKSSAKAALPRNTMAGIRQFVHLESTPTGDSHRVSSVRSMGVAGLRVPYFPFRQSTP